MRPARPRGKESRVRGKVTVALGLCTIGIVGVLAWRVLLLSARSEFVPALEQGLRRNRFAAISPQIAQESLEAVRMLRRQAMLSGKNREAMATVEEGPVRVRGGVNMSSRDREELRKALRGFK